MEALGGDDKGLRFQVLTTANCLPTLANC